jgi:O-antigen ligase
MAQFTWFPNQTTYNDFFLYYKQNLLIFLSIIMLIIALYQIWQRRRNNIMLPVFVPLAAYALLAILSAVFSKYPSFSYKGSMDQFESIFALLGYCIIVYYVYLNLNTERELQLLLQVMICVALIMSLIGVLQFMGYDPFTSELGYRLIVPSEYRGENAIEASFGSKRVYMTLFNPNYVGVYIALVTPIILSLMFFQKSKIWIILSALAVLGLLICEFGSLSLAGLLGLCAATVMMVIFLRRYLFKKPRVAIAVMVLLLSGILAMNMATGNFLVNKLKGMFQTSTVEYSLTNIETMDDGISLTYKDKQIKVSNDVDESGVMSLIVTDQNDNLLITNYDISANCYRIADQQLSELGLGFDTTQPGIFYIEAEGTRYRFSNMLEDGTYYYLNQFNKWDKLETAPSSLFRGYESFASGRGYIWSRTIPLLKDYIILGSGPDTFVTAFPQDDYMNLNRSGFAGQTLTKPHNLYLQIAVQTGMLSLIAFLVFYGMYFVSSFRLYIRSQFDSYFEKSGVAIFIGTVAYMITGLTNDSSITVAPIFWTLMGVGIAINQKLSLQLKKKKAKENQK